MSNTVIIVWKYRFGHVSHNTALKQAHSDLSSLLYLYYVGNEALQFQAHATEPIGEDLSEFIFALSKSIFVSSSDIT